MSMTTHPTDNALLPKEIWYTNVGDFYYQCENGFGTKYIRADLYTPAPPAQAEPTDAAEVGYIDIKMEEYKCECGRKNLRVHKTTISPAQATKPNEPTDAERKALEALDMEIATLKKQVELIRLRCDQHKTTLCDAVTITNNMLLMAARLEKACVALQSKS